MKGLSMIFQHNFFQLWHPVMLLILIAIGVLYFMVTGRWRNKYPNAKPVSSLKKTLFVLGLVLFYIVEGSPVKLISHYLFSVHMTSMAVNYLMVPPLIIFGLPRWLLHHYIYRKPKVKKITAALTKPFTALLTFSILFSFYHMPLIMDFIMANMDIGLMTIANIILFFTSFMAWWLVITPLPELNRISELQKLGYIFAWGVLLTPACALIAFSSEPIYSVYAGKTQLFGMTQVHDQQAGGVIMKSAQEFVFAITLVSVVINWGLKARKSDLKKDKDAYGVSAMAQSIRPKNN